MKYLFLVLFLMAEIGVTNAQGLVSPQRLESLTQQSSFGALEKMYSKGFKLNRAGMEMDLKTYLHGLSKKHETLRNLKIRQILIDRYAIGSIDHWLLYEVVSGMVGEKNVTYTNLRFIEVKGAKIIRETQQDDGGYEAGQAGQPAKDFETVVKSVEEANAVSNYRSCRSQGISELEKGWEQMRLIMEGTGSLEGRIPESILAKNYRLTFSMDPATDSKGVVHFNRENRRTSLHSDMSGLRTLSVGPKFIVKYGQSRAISTMVGQPITLRFHDLQFLSVCEQKISRHFSQFDMGGFMSSIAQMEAPYQTPIPTASGAASRVALRFLDATKIKNFSAVRKTLHDKFIHLSPNDHVVGGDAWVSFYKMISVNFQWDYKLKSITESANGVVVVVYDSFINGQSTGEIVETFDVRGGKIVRAENIY